MRLMNRRGVTLIELLTVLALFISLLGMVTVGFTNFFRQRDPELFMKDMTSYVRYLQFKTIEEGKIHKLSVQSDEGTLQTYVQDQGTNFLPLHDSLSKRFEQKGIYQFEIDSDEIYFFPDGTVTRNEIRLLSDDHKIASLFIKNRLGTLRTEFYAQT